MSSKYTSVITFPREVVLFYSAYGKASHKATYSLTFCMWYWELNPDPCACETSHLPLSDIPAKTNIFNRFWKSSMGLMKIEWKVKESLILICLLPFSSLWQNSQKNRLLKKLLLISGFCFCLFLRFSLCSWCHCFLPSNKHVLVCSRLKLPTGSGQEKKERAVERGQREVILTHPWP